MRWVILLIPLLFLGCIQNVTTEEKTKNVTPNSTTELRNLILRNPDEYLYPFDGFSYDNISVKVEGSYVYVTAKCSELEGEDTYLFVNDNGTLMLRSYCLEALPESVKLEAISIAMSNETIAKNANGFVTVRRILPQTSAKFYKPKELFSVTWHGSKIVSALVDLDKKKVVAVWVR